MQVRSALSVVMVTVLAVGTSRADFKYTQTTKMTGGAMVSMTKTLGVFSKNARQANEPQVSTHMLKGNRLRDERADGSVTIIDLDGKRFIHIDTAKKTYSIQTFEQFRQQMEQAKAKMKEEQAKQAAKHPESQNVKMVPHFDAQTTGATKTVLGLTTNEMKVKMDVEFQSDDPAQQAKLQQGGGGTMWVTSDEWIAQSVPGYDQVRAFYEKMAKELDWLPGEMGSMMGANSQQMGSAMQEFRKHSTTIKGMPMLMYTSMGMGAPAAPGTQPAQQQQAQQSDNSSSSSPKDAIVKGLGGMFKKKQQPQPDSANQPASATGPAPAAPSNSLMDTATEVTAYSTDPLDSSLFDVPAGYTLVQLDPNHPAAF